MITAALILGIDFLSAYHCQWNWGDNTIVINGQETSLSYDKHGPSVSRVHMENTIVPAGHEAIVRRHMPPQQEGIGMVYPNLESGDRCQVAIATSLVDMGMGTLPVQVLNPTSDPVTIYKGPHLALFLPVDYRDVIEVEGANQAHTVQHLTSSMLVSACRETNKVPAHLRDILDRGTRDLQQT